MMDPSLSAATTTDHLFEGGVSVRDNFIPVLLLFNLSKKVILSNVPPFIPNNMLERILVCYGKIVGSMKMSFVVFVLWLFEFLSLIPMTSFNMGSFVGALRRELHYLIIYS